MPIKAGLSLNGFVIGSYKALVLLLFCVCLFF